MQQSKNEKSLEIIRKSNDFKAFCVGVEGALLVNYTTLFSTK